MKNMAEYIDHTILNADATEAEVSKVCQEAAEYNFKTVCIQPYWIPFVKEELEGTGVGITTVIGFPLGANATETKVFEAKQALKDGATEVDMVINIGALKSADYDHVLKDIKAVVEAVAEEAIVKVIIETALLTKEEKIKASELSKKAGADFVKTSTGFSTGGATVEDIKLMRATVGPDLGVKASGGVRSYEDAKAMIDAGATRIGASSGISIVKGEESTDSSY